MLRRSRRSLRVSDSSRRSKPQGAAENKSISLIGGFGDRSRVTLRYIARFAMTTTVSDDQYAFRANDCYDPDETGIGGQPANFDDWMTIYSRFKVHGSRARLSCTSITSAAPSLVSFGARQSTGTGQVLDDASRPRHEVRWVGITTNGGHQGFDMQYSTSAVMGYTKSQYEGTEALNGTSAASPTKQWYWVVRQGSYDTSTSTSCRYVITIDYDVEFFERIDQTLDLLGKIAAVSAQLQKLQAKLPATAKIERTERKEGPPTGRAAIAAGAGSLGLEPEYELVQIARKR